MIEEVCVICIFSEVKRRCKKIVVFLQCSIITNVPIAQHFKFHSKSKVTIFLKLFSHHRPLEVAGQFSLETKVPQSVKRKVNSQTKNLIGHEVARPVTVYFSGWNLE